MEASQPQLQPEPTSVTANQAIIFFSAPLVKKLSLPECRLEPTYVGVRRVRPSCRLVKEVFNGKKVEQPSESTNSDGKLVSPVTFKIKGEDGVERRMTKQEKKALKLSIAQQKKREKEQRRLEREQNNEQPAAKKERKRKKEVEEKLAKEDSCTTDEEEEDPIAAALARVGLPPPKRSLIEQELADLRGDRNGVPPVILQPSLAQAAFQTTGLLPGNVLCPQPSQSEKIWIDNELAQEWSAAIQESMVPALEVRGREDMRSMAYDIVPEPWQRLRPDSVAAGEFVIEPAKEEDSPKDAKTSKTATNTSSGVEPWALVSIRPPALPSTFDSDIAIVAQVLHRNTTLHVSCGSKFGCDFLVYDGPRSERHAFAGLRVINNEGNLPYRAAPSAATTNRTFPVPSSYAMAGYVRCLNTAGKLALIALVQREDQADGSQSCRVAFVDLKLERVDGTKRKDMEERIQKLERS